LSETTQVEVRLEYYMTLLIPQDDIHYRYDMEKKEVEKNEEGLFAKWIAEMDNNVETWRSEGVVVENSQDDQSDHSVEALKRSPTYFERNLEVWRQV
jgi:hypothetical protein